MLEDRFERLTKLPDSPARLTADATLPGGDIKRVLLSREDYYSMTGGHGACRGCGEVTALHLFNSLSHRIGADRRREHLRILDETLDRLAGLRELLPGGARASTGSTPRSPSWNDGCTCTNLVRPATGRRPR